MDLHLIKEWVIVISLILIPTAYILISIQAFIDLKLNIGYIPRYLYIIIPLGFYGVLWLWCIGCAFLIDKQEILYDFINFYKELLNGK